MLTMRNGLSLYPICLPGMPQQPNQVSQAKVDVYDTDKYLNISLLEECGFIERALEELHKKEFKMVDKLSYKEPEVSLLEKLGRLSEGEEFYKKLLSMNPDNYGICRN